MKNQKGFTLIELIIVIALLLIVIAGGFHFLSFGNTIHRLTLQEAEIQSAARLTTEHINNIVRFSRAAFTIPRSSFNRKRDEGWNYIGIDKEGNVVFDEDDGRSSDERVENPSKILAKANDKITYRIFFHRVEEDSREKIIGFSIQGFIEGREIEVDGDGNEIGHINIFSQAEALNSMQVVHQGTEGDPAVAIAFREDRREGPTLILTPEAHITMVLDISGSMEWNLNGSTTWVEEDRRIYMLKEAAKKLINDFTASGFSVHISLVPFSNTANNPSSFYNAADNHEKQQLLNKIQNLSAEGGTNTGDGIRRGYYQLVNRRNAIDPDQRITEHMIILVDGVTTFGTRTGNNPNTHDFMTSDGNVLNTSRSSRILFWWTGGQIHGNGSNLDTDHGEPYVERIGQMIRNDRNEEGEQKIATYLIGFSNKPDDFGSLESISQAVNTEATDEGTPFMEATDSLELELAFGTIYEHITTSLWEISGPEL